MRAYPRRHALTRPSSVGMPDSGGIGQLRPVIGFLSAHRHPWPSAQLLTTAPSCFGTGPTHRTPFPIGRATTSRRLWRVWRSGKGVCCLLILHGCACQTYAAFKIRMHEIQAATWQLRRGMLEEAYLPKLGTRSPAVILWRICTIMVPWTEP